MALTRPGYPVVFDGTNQNPLLTTIDGLAYRGGYCTIADVQDFFINLDNWSKLQSRADLWAKAIADASEDMDRVLEPYYVTPIVGVNGAPATKALQHMHFICRHKAAGAIFEHMTAGGAADEQAEQHATRSLIHEDRAAQRLDDVLNGVTQFFDAAPQPGGEKPAFPAGVIAQWNSDYDPNLPPPDDARATAPLFGVRNDPAYRDTTWIP